MGLLKGKNLIVTGVIAESSIAYAFARLACAEGANVVLTSYGRHSLVRRLSRRLPSEPPVIELDVTNAEHLATLAERARLHVSHVDGVLHSIAAAPQACIGDRFLEADWADVSSAFHVSAFSLKSLAMACHPLLRPGSSIVGLDFDASRAWTGYDWMGVAKAGLEACSRYLARYLGPSQIRVNLVAAGPLSTLAGRGVGADEDRFTADWAARAPLGWNPRDAEPVARTCAMLMSDWFPATTGAIIRADGGYHMMA